MNEKVKQELLEDIKSAKTELDVAKNNYNFVSGKDLIDLYAYKIIAAQTKCDYLIKKAKNFGINITMFEALDTSRQKYQP